jgi:hypothetical protein
MFGAEFGGFQNPFRWMFGTGFGGFAIRRI